MKNDKRKKIEKNAKYVVLHWKKESTDIPAFDLLYDDKGEYRKEIFYIEDGMIFIQLFDTEEEAKRYIQERS